MFKEWLTYIKEGDVYAGLEICVHKGSPCYNLILLNKRKGELHITQEIQVKKLSEISQYLKKSTPLLLTINTSEVLAKKMNNYEQPNPKALVNEAFPNLNLENFYYSILLNQGSPIVTIAKKDYVDGIIEQLKLLKHKPVQIALGTGAIENILMYLEDLSIETSNYRLEIANQKIETMQHSVVASPGDYSINGLHISGNSLLAFSNILGFIGKKTINSNLKDFNAIGVKEFINNRIFNLGLKSSLVFFLVLLLSNFFVFDHYFGQLDSLKTAMELNNSRITELKELETSVSKKQQRVALLSSSSGSKVSYYLDEFAKEIPKSILLDKITFQPLEKPMRELKPILLESHQILVAGISKSGEDFSKWIVGLERKEWVNSVETLDYDYVTSNASRFLIKIECSEK